MHQSFSGSAPEIATDGILQNLPFASDARDAGNENWIPDLNPTGGSVQNGTC